MCHPDFNLGDLGCVYCLFPHSAILKGKTHGQVPTPIIYPNNGNNNGNDNNYYANSPFKTEVARLDAIVYRNGKEPLPLMEVPRLNEGDILKIKLANEPVNGVMPSQSNLDWTLLVAFINPSKGQDKNSILSEEIRLKDSGWYKDNFFKVPYDCQPIIFLYPKGNYRKKILDIIQKKPDDQTYRAKKSSKFRERMLN